MQIVFQDPYASLNPRMRVRAIVGEGIENPQARARRREGGAHRRTARGWSGSTPTRSTAIRTNSPAASASGSGSRARWRSSPRFLVLDEPVSALDVSIQAQIINLLQDLQERLKLTYLFIAHDLRVVEHISRRVAIMYLGKIVELADRDEIYANPRHPYTRALLSAMPMIEAAEQARAHPACPARCQARSIRPRAAASIRAAHMRKMYAVPSSRRW